MRYIIEISKLHATSVTYTYVLEGVPKEVHPRCNHLSTRTYPLVWSNNPETYNIDYPIFITRPKVLHLEKDVDVKVTKHYKTFEDFIADHLDLFL